MVQTRSSSKPYVLRSASKPRAACPPPPKRRSSAVGAGGGKSGSPTEDRGKVPADSGAVCPNFSKSAESAMVQTRSSSKSYFLRSASKPHRAVCPPPNRPLSVGGRKSNEDRGKAPANSRAVRRNSVCSKKVGTRSGGRGRDAPPSCTAAKTSAQPNTLSSDKVSVTEQAWWWSEPIDPWLDAANLDERASHFDFFCLPHNDDAEYMQKVEKVEAAIRSEILGSHLGGKGDDVPPSFDIFADLRKAWWWYDPWHSDESDEESEKSPGGSRVFEHRPKWEGPRAPEPDLEFYKRTFD